MKKTTEVSCEVVTAYVCDRCKRTAEVGDPELSEFITIEFTGGYDSVFGDGTKVSLDMCQHCFKETLGKWINTVST